MESCANAMFTFDPDVATMHFNNEFANCQSQACTAYAVIRRIGPIEFLEKMRLLLRCHANALILYANADLHFTDLAAYPDGAAIG